MTLHNTHTSDTELLGECLRGKEWAWELFYERFSRLVSSVVKRAASRYASVSTAEEINDCTQFVWASFIEKECYILKKWGGKCSLATWLRVCGSHAASGYFKSMAKQIHTIPVDEIPPMSVSVNVNTPHNTFDAVSRNEMLEKILWIVENRLSKQERLFAKLYWFKKLSFDEISKILGISLENAHLLKHRAEKKIMRYMKTVRNN
ncbi:MAG: sigma-70 family RNA polymerase sigma factor [bacterium]